MRPQRLRLILLFIFYFIIVHNSKAQNEIEAKPTITSELTYMSSRGSAFYYEVIATGNPTNYNASNLPEGITFDTNTGKFGGRFLVTGEYQITLSATNLSGSSSAVLSIEVVEDPFLPYLNSIPPVHEVISETEISENGKQITVKRFTFKSRNNANTVYAIMAAPKEAGTYPGLMYLHGGGSEAEGTYNYLKYFASLGYVTIGIDLPGLHGLDKAEYSTGPYRARGGGEGPRLDVTEGAGKSVLVDAEVAAIEALNLLQSQSNVDPDKLGVAGFSWGGYSTTMMAGLLGNKVKAAYAVFGCGFYDKGSFWKGSLENLSETDRNLWLTYLDAGRRASNMTAAYFLEAASNDTYFWPEAVENTLGEVPGNKNHTWGPNKNHQQVASSRTMMEHHFGYYLKSEGKPFVSASVTQAARKDDGSGIVDVELDISTSVSIRSVRLYYSTTDNNWQERIWVPVTAQLLQDNKYRAELTTDIVSKNVDYYIYVIDSRRIVTSTYMHNTQDFTYPLSIRETDIEEKVLIFPNPNSGKFYVKLNKSEKAVLTVVDANGKLVYSELIHPSEKPIQFNLNKKPAGVYYIKLISDQLNVVKKLVITGLN